MAMEIVANRDSVILKPCRIRSNTKSFEDELSSSARRPPRPWASAPPRLLTSRGTEIKPSPVCKRLRLLQQAKTLEPLDLKTKPQISDGKTVAAKLNLSSSARRIDGDKSLGMLEIICCCAQDLLEQSVKFIWFG
jgi:hypothetical protein